MKITITRVQYNILNNGIVTLTFIELTRLIISPDYCEWIGRLSVSFSKFVFNNVKHRLLFTK